MFNILAPILSIYALSDIYNVMSYGRLKTFINEENIPYITMLSGDFLSPSNYSSVDFGKTLMRAVKEVPIDYVSFGNHEFDIPVEKLNEIIKSNEISTFISSNIYDIPNTIPFYIYDNNEITIGILGLCMTNFYTSYELNSEDPIEIAKIIVPMIQHKYKPDLLIAMTHMFIEDDIKLIENVNGIDIILGGHVHDFNYTFYKNVPIIRTGENADIMTRLKLYPNKQFEIDFVDLSKYSVDSEIIKIGEEGDKLLSEHSKKVIFTLDKKYKLLRQRTRLEEMCVYICSLINKHLNTDFTILNGGLFRHKQIYKNDFTVGDLNMLFPFDNEIITLKMNGHDIIKAISYSHQKHYNLGGFLQHNNASFNIDLDKKYLVSTSKKLLNGLDDNPYFRKYNNFIDRIGTPIKTILTNL